MTKYITLIALFWVSISTLSISQSIEPLPQPRVLFYAQNFYHPVQGSYVELYLSFDASSLTQVQVGDYYQAQLEVLYLIKKNEKIIKYDKFQVLGPELGGPKLYQDFIDVQTFTLKPGEYTVDVTIQDANKMVKPLKASQKLVVTLDERKMVVSDIMFEKSVTESLDDIPLVKNGLLMTPWLVSTLPNFMDEIYLYAEVYNSDYKLGKSGAYVEKHSLKNLDVDSLFPDFAAVKRVNTSEVNVILKRIDLTKLPQGAYLYSIELYNRENELVASNGRQFYRESSIPALQKNINIVGFADFETIINSETNRDTIVDYFRSIRPIGDHVHQNFIDNNWKTSSSEVLKAYIISFWTFYKKEEPAKEWLKYRALVHVVNKEFGNSVQKGYDTDRGMVYLQYGPPDQMVVRENEPSSYPYIIWQYYKHPLMSNAMYVFYDPSLTYRDYLLLHSNVRGEKNNDRWKLILQSRNNPNVDIDQESGVDHWGGEVDDYYENPR